MSKKSNRYDGGIGMLGTMFLIFLTLKLAGIGVVADWSWWLVTAPLWGGIALALVVVIVVLLFVAFVASLVVLKNFFDARQVIRLRIRVSAADFWRRLKVRRFWRKRDKGGRGE